MRKVRFRRGRRLDIDEVGSADECLQQKVEPKEVCSALNGERPIFGAND